MIKKLKNSGVFWLLVSGFAFSLMQVFIKLTSEAVTVFMQVMFRNMVGVAIAAVILKKENNSWFGTKEQQPALFGRSIAGFLGLIFYFLASRMASSIADATIVNRTGPFFTTLFSVLFLKEKTTPVQWVALVVVFLGGVVAANPTFDSAAIPMLFAFGSAVANGVAYTMLAYFRGKVPTMTVVMHFSVFSVLAALPFVIADFAMPTAMDFVMLVMIALLGSLGQISITVAYRLAPASEISIFDQLSVVMSVVFGWMFLGQTPGLHTLLGGTIVIVASVWIFYYNKNRHRQMAAQTK